MNFRHFFGQIIAKLRARVPVKLPIGMWEFEQFVAELFSIYELPDLPSYRQAVATMIMHLPPTQDRAPMRFFAQSLKKSMANQIAYEIIQGIKQAEKEAAELAAIEKAPEPPV